MWRRKKSKNNFFETSFIFLFEKSKNHFLKKKVLMIGESFLNWQFEKDKSFFSRDQNIFKIFVHLKSCGLHLIFFQKWIIGCGKFFEQNRQTIGATRLIGKSGACYAADPGSNLGERGLWYIDCAFDLAFESRSVGWQTMQSDITDGNIPYMVPMAQGTWEYYQTPCCRV